MRYFHQRDIGYVLRSSFIFVVSSSAVYQELSRYFSLYIWFMISFYCVGYWSSGCSGCIHLRNGNWDRFLTLKKIPEIPEKSRLFYNVTNPKIGQCCYAENYYLVILQRLHLMNFSVIISDRIKMTFLIMYFSRLPCFSSRSCGCPFNILRTCLAHFNDYQFSMTCINKWKLDKSIALFINIYKTLISFGSWGNRTRRSVHYYTPDLQLTN